MASDSEMLLEMARHNWQGCHCGVKTKQAADSVKIRTDHGTNYQIPMFCPKCKKRARLTMMVKNGYTLKESYDAWRQGMVLPPTTNEPRRIVLP